MKKLYIVTARYFKYGGQMETTTFEIEAVDGPDAEARAYHKLRHINDTTFNYQKIMYNARVIGVVKFKGEGQHLKTHK